MASLRRTNKTNKEQKRNEEDYLLKEILAHGLKFVLEQLDAGRKGTGNITGQKESDDIDNFGQFGQNVIEDIANVIMQK